MLFSKNGDELTILFPVAFWLQLVLKLNSLWGKKTLSVIVMW